MVEVEEEGRKGRPLISMIFPLGAEERVEGGPVICKIISFRLEI